MLDPDMTRVLESLKAMKPMEEMTLEELRAFVVPTPVEQRRPVGGIEDFATPGGIPIRLYRPTRRRSDNLMVYLHGGGFVIGSIETHENVARNFCEALGANTLSVEYRLAPEHRFPAGLDDCLAAVRWAAAHASELGVSRDRIILGGDSAGATLAAVTCLRLRDDGGPAIAGQVLGYPVTDYHTPPTQSYIDNAKGYSLTRAAMIRFWRYYINDASEQRHPYAAPLNAADLSSLPPALILTAEYDPLRDEGEAYAARLRESGVPVKLTRYDGLIHGFLRMTAISSRAAATFEDIREWVDSLLPPVWRATQPDFRDYPSTAVTASSTTN
jgi:acetyl esterase